MPVRIGYKASAEQFGPRRLVELGVLAERHGFDTVTVSDHYQPWRHEGGHAPFSLAWMSAVGERTERVLLGTSVLTPTFRYHPAVIAQAFATMGCLFPGRVMLGSHRRGLNEVAVTGRVARVQDRFAACASRAVDPRAVERRARDLRGRLTRRPGPVYDRGDPGPDLRRRRGRRSRATPARGATVSSSRAARSWSATPRISPLVAEGLEKPAARTR